MFDKQKKQQIVNDYLHKTGRNMLHPAEFLDWLRDQPDHECHGLFFGMAEAEAAQAYRLDLVRKWVSGLRITITREEPLTREVGKVTMREHTLPLAFSPVGSRASGGGYVATDPNDPEHLAELGRQASVALSGWLERFGGTAALLGVDVAAIRKVVEKLDKVTAPKEAA